MARRYSKENNINLIVKKADWSIGKVAGPIRNLEIVKDATHLIAFPHVSGSGTQNTIELAKKHGVKILKIENV